MGSVTLTVVGNEVEAEILCGLLQANGLEGWYRRTDAAEVLPAYGGAGIGMAGPTEVLVAERDLEAARKLLPAS